MNFMILLLVVSVVSYLAMKKIQAPVDKPGLHDQGVLQPAHVAWMVGGPRRALEALWVELQATHSIFIVELYDTMEVRRVEESPALSGRARDAYRLLSTTSSLTSAAKCMPPVLEKIKVDLQKLGLQVKDDDLASRRRLRLAFLALLVAAVAISLFVGMELWQSALLTMAGLVMGGQSPRQRLTLAGLQVRERFLREHAHLRLAPQEADVALAVALGGLSVLSGTPWDSHAAPLRKQRNAHSTTGSGGCGGCSSAILVASSCGTAAATSSDSSSSSGGFSSGGGFGSSGHSTGCGSSSSDSGSSSGGGGCGGGGCGGGGGD